MDQKSNPLRSSTSDGDSESTSSSSRSSSNKPKVGQASLTVSRLESMHAVQTMDADDVCQTAQHGMSKDRILCWRGMCVTVGAPCRPVIYTESAKLFGNFQSMPKMQCYGPYNQNALSVGASGHLKDHIVPVWFHIASAIHDK